MPYSEKEKANKRSYYLAHKKEINQYYKEKYLKNKEKIKTQVKERYRKNRGKVLKRQKEYYQKNKEEIKERNKFWVLNHSEKVKEIKARYREKHREKLRSDGREYSKNNRGKSNKNKKIWRAKNPHKIKEEKLKSRFKISLKDYNELLKKQNNCCGICNTEFKFNKPNDPAEPCVDHDHGELGKIRGILCRRCNSGTGGLKDNPVLLKKAFLWVQKEIKKEAVKSTPVTLKISLDRKYTLKSRYELSVEQYQTLYTEQKGKCGICNKEFVNCSNVSKNMRGLGGINIDHSHISGKLRGLLCPQCNRSIGLLKDDPKIIKNAIDWITQKE
jgi:hypothetical protein